MEEQAVGALLLREKAHDRRIRLFSALLAKESGLGTEGLTVVGGSAIEIYTEGDYVSADIDLVVDSRPSVTAVLERWGFRDEGSRPRVRRVAEPTRGIRSRDSLGRNCRSEH
jgi:hypothetical protein